jgi:hypothetical protein
VKRRRQSRIALETTYDTSQIRLPGRPDGRRGTNVERRVKLRHEDQALEVCKGIVLGFYRAEHRGFELLEYAEDSPSELASHAVEIWRRRGRHCTFPRNFVEKYTPNWAWLVR